MSDTTSIDMLKADIAELEAQIKDKKAELRALRPVKAKAEPKECGCGCGELTRGGDFLPGHDARFRGQMLKAIDAGDESAIAALLARPTLLHGATEADLRARLGSEVKRKEAQVEREAEAQAKRDAAQVEREAEAQAKRDAAKTKKVRPAPKPTAKPRVDKVEVQQGTKSPSVARNAGAIRLAKQRAAA